jgi:hypothetical protein
MTTRWTISRAWRGATVAVLASGPAMSVEVAERLRHLRCVAVKHTHQLAPWADMLVALDSPWPADFRGFAGLKVCGLEDPALDALYAGPFWENVLLDDGSRVEIRNSGLAAIRIAVAMGAANVVLAGFAPRCGTRWHDTTPRPYTGVAEALRAMQDEYGARGVRIDHLEDGGVHG